jgi:hypothetical protein
MYLREIGWEVADWIFLTQDKDRWVTVAKTVMNLRVLRNVGNFLKIWEMTCSSIKTLFAGVTYLANCNKGKIQTFGRLSEWEILKYSRQSRCSSRWHSNWRWLKKKERMAHNHSTAIADLKRLRDKQWLPWNTVSDGGYHRLFENVAASFPWSAWENSLSVWLKRESK